MLHRTALCVGINQYQNFPSANLNGCVNDARDMASLLKGLLGFPVHSSGEENFVFFTCQIIAQRSKE